ncbi:MAG: DUF2267 domain-containing protein [Candidatus Promineifilaceae bacterium]
MTDNDIATLDGFYEHVREAGKLPTSQHALRWTNAVLKALGTVLDGSTKRSLAKELPKPLAQSLTSVFWLLHFRDPNLSDEEFLKRVAIRSGNSDPEFARYPTRAVFSQLRQLISPEVDQKVTDALSPEVSQLWRLDSRVPVAQR